MDGKVYAGHCAICGSEMIGTIDGMGNLICDDCKNDGVFA